jgi:hypothetical protein
MICGCIVVWITCGRLGAYVASLAEHGVGALEPSPKTRDVVFMGIILPGYGEIRNFVGLQRNKLNS